MFPITPVYYSDVQDIMLDLEAISVMSEAILDDVDAEESRVEDEVMS